MAFVSSARIHVSETYAPNVSDLQRVPQNACAMIGWICGVKLNDEISSIALHQKLGIGDITVVLRTRRLRWYGHVQRASSCIGSFSHDDPRKQIVGV